MPHRTIVLLWSLCAASCVRAGFTSDLPGTRSDGAAADHLAEGTGLLPDGEPCTTDSECDSACSDGVCRAPALHLAAGDRHTCAVTDDGLQCWGGNDHGQLGDGTRQSRARPTASFVPGTGVQIVAVDCEQDNTCAVAQGGVWCWGLNSFGQIGSGAADTPPLAADPTPVNALAAGSGAESVSVGREFACAVVLGGVQCWGANWRHQLGDESSVSVRGSPVQVHGLPPGSGVTAMGSGFRHTCAVAAGAALCWGYGVQGALGTGDLADRGKATQVQGLTSKVTDIAVGAAHTCAVVDGGVRCWGDNEWGQIGDGTRTPRPTPVEVLAAGSGATAVSASTQGHTCAVVNGGVQCWGANSAGQLGDGGLEYSTSPVQVPGLPPGSGVIRVVAGGWHTCALLDGGVRCWGANGAGQLGIGRFAGAADASTSPSVAAHGALVSAENMHTCAVVDGGVQCWGENTRGQLGDLGKVSSGTPGWVHQLGALVGATDAATGRAHSCAVVAGKVSCWGLNHRGMLGDGSTTSTTSPVATAGGMTGVSSVSCATGHCCAVVDAGLRCWGSNDAGQLGDGTTTQRTSPAWVTDLAAGSGVQAVACGHHHTCAIIGGGVRCWGADWAGQRGMGSINNERHTADQWVLGLGANSGAMWVAAGDAHTCAVVGGGVQCWGSNKAGQVGNGLTSSTVSTSGWVVGIGENTGATVVALGRQHSCTVVSGGVRCWGTGAAGQLGDGGRTARAAPVAVTGLAHPVSSLAGGAIHTCAVSNGGVYCWGGNSLGQLGSGQLDVARTPEKIVLWGS